VLVEVKVPQLAESVTAASLLEWQKQPGEAVERGDNLIDIETDKVVLEVTAADSGVLKEIRKSGGNEVSSNEVIAIIDTDRGDQAAGAESGGARAAAAVTESPQAARADHAIIPASKIEPTHSTSTTRVEADTVSQVAPGTATHGATQGPFEKGYSENNELRAGPAVRKLLTENQLDPREITGSGKDGRITKADVIAQLEVEPTPQPEPPARIAETPPELEGDVGSARRERRVPMTRLRKRVAERLLQAQRDNAILTTFNEVDMQPVATLRQRYRERFEKAHGVRLGFMGFFVLAAIEALKRFPVVNASIEGNDIIYHGYFDIGIAVSSPRGLVVPILRDAQQLTVAEIEKGVAEFGRKAKENTLILEELTGGTFTITNGGVFGSLLSTPILNPPQSAILGMHKIEDRPIVRNGEMLIRPMMYLALSYDHRIIDGRDAVQFLVTIKEQIEDPSRLLLQV
jgi:2-oxoglutarate dehydrogenase E2 component (dihydrolipoamide succinyltransferase)